MPFTNPNIPSIQTGCLKSYIDLKFKDKKELRTYTYSAHLSVLLRAFKERFYDIFSNYKFKPEVLWFLLVLRRFNIVDRNKDPKRLFNNLFIRYNKHLEINGQQKLTINKLRMIEEATIDFIEEDLVPNLHKKELNIVGFSLTNDQIYASLFCYLYLLEKFHRYKLFFVFGGSLASCPRVIKTLKKFNANGLVVGGEGELKLEQIIKTCLDNKEHDLKDLYKKCNNCVPGVYNIGSIAKDISFLDSGIRLSSIEDLPPPDYDEYLEVLRKHTYDEDAFLIMKNNITFVMEGSRGCSWGKCDFCWGTEESRVYRGKSVDKIYEQFVHLLKKYRISRISFIDNLCDLWITKFCDRLLGEGINLSTMNELRAVHDEHFYTRLSLVGCDGVQVGIESLSPGLLKRMNKGAKLFHNVAVLKYLKELNMGVSANLIINHPKSSLEDIEYTKKILKILPHFPKLSLSSFVLAEDSHIYKELTEEERVGLEQQNIFNMPLELAELFSDDLMLPAYKDLPVKLKKSWNDYSKWHEAQDTKDRYLIVLRVDPNSIYIKDNRSGAVQEHFFSGKAERAYTLCHSPRTIDSLLKESGLTQKELEPILKDFLNKKLMILSEDRYLSISLRPREELINNYYMNSKKS